MKEKIQLGKLVPRYSVPWLLGALAWQLGLRLEEIGPAFEHHAAFPEGVNTEFVQVMDATHLKMRVWERGSGETWACGTGTCATVAALVEQGVCPRETDVAVALVGGTLTIRVGADGSLRMTGPARTVYEGVAEV